MNKITGVVTLCLLLVFALGSTSQAITRVARKLYVFDVYGGYSKPVGSYNGLPGFSDIDFLINNRFVDVSAEDVYEDTYHLGFDIGQLWSEHFMVTFGFRFSDLKVKDTIPLPFDSIIVFREDIRLRQYDLNFDANYLPLRIAESFWSPYVGVGVGGGISSGSVSGYASENQLTFVARLNFGAEVKFFTAPSGKSFFTLASANSWDFVSSNDRPKHLNIGGAIRYYFRM